MELFLNTSNPLMMLIIVAFMAVVIFISRKAEVSWPVAIFMAGIIGFLVYHTLYLDKLDKGSSEISIIYHCIACDLINILILFISYLWIDDIVAKKKKIKSYDDSLSWFWNKL